MTNTRRPNVIVTGHQAFFTEEAITTICETTINSATEFATGQALSNEIRYIRESCQEH